MLAGRLPQYGLCFAPLLDRGQHDAEPEHRLDADVAVRRDLPQLGDGDLVLLAQHRDGALQEMPAGVLDHLGDGFRSTVRISRGEPAEGLGVPDVVRGLQRVGEPPARLEVGAQPALVRVAFLTEASDAGDQLVQSRLVIAAGRVESEPGIRHSRVQLHRPGEGVERGRLVRRRRLLARLGEAELLGAAYPQPPSPPSPQQPRRLLRHTDYSLSEVRPRASSHPRGAERAGTDRLRSS
nr:hypothetical protein [Kribbella qitaiheensis]